MGGFADTPPQPGHRTVATNLGHCINARRVERRHRIPSTASRAAALTTRVGRHLSRGGGADPSAMSTAASRPAKRLRCRVFDTTRNERGRAIRRYGPRLLAVDWFPRSQLWEDKVNPGGTGSVLPVPPFLSGDLNVATGVSA